MKSFWRAQTCPGLFAGRPAGFEVPTIGKVYLAVVALECAVMFGISGMLFATTSFNSLGGIYASLGVTCTLGMLLFAMDSIMSENRFQLVTSQIAEALFTSFLLFESIRNPNSLGEAWTSTHWIFAGVKIGFQVLQLALAVPVWKAFGYYTYKVAGANVLMRQMFDRYRIFLSLIKLDLFAAVVLFVLIKTYLISFEAVDFALGIASLVASAAFSVLGWYAITNERRWLVWLFVACALVQPSYIVFKGVAIEQRPDTIPANVTLTQFIILGSLAVVLRVLLLVSAIRCYCDFGRGLMQVVFHNRQWRRDVTSGRLPQPLNVAALPGLGSGAGKDAARVPLLDDAAAVGGADHGGAGLLSIAPRAPTASAAAALLSAARVVPPDNWGGGAAAAGASGVSSIQVGSSGASTAPASAPLLGSYGGSSSSTTSSGSPPAGAGRRGDDRHHDGVTMIPVGSSSPSASSANLRLHGHGHGIAAAAGPRLGGELVLTEGGAWRPASTPNVLASPQAHSSAGSGAAGSGAESVYSPLPHAAGGGYAVAGGDIEGEEELPMDEY